MADQDSVVANRYAKALFDLAKEQKKLDAVEKNIVAFTTSVEDSIEFKATLANPAISRGTMQKILTEVSKKAKLEKITQNFLQLLAQNRRVALIDKIAAAFEGYLDEHRNAVVAKITVAKKLTAAQQKELVKSLKSSTGKDVRLDIVIDEQILGGMIIKVGSTMLDGSLSGKLGELQRLSKQAVATL